jgi:hypothetical protein
MMIDIPARHRMEYIYGFIVNKIIKDFKGIAFPVKTDEQISVPVFSFIKPTVIDSGIKSPSNVIFGYIVLKGGRTELDGDVHVLLYHNSRLFETAFSPKLHAEASFASKQRHKGRRDGQFCRPADCPALVFND